MLMCQPSTKISFVSLITLVSLMGAAGSVLAMDVDDAPVVATRARAANVEDLQAQNAALQNEIHDLKEFSCRIIQELEKNEQEYQHRVDEKSRELYGLQQEVQRLAHPPKGTVERDKDVKKKEVTNSLLYSPYYHALVSLMGATRNVLAMDVDDAPVATRTRTANVKDLQEQNAALQKKKQDLKGFNDNINQELKKRKQEYLHRVDEKMRDIYCQQQEIVRLTNAREGKFEENKKDYWSWVGSPYYGRNL